MTFDLCSEEVIHYDGPVRLTASLDAVHDKLQDGHHASVQRVQEGVKQDGGDLVCWHDGLHNAAETVWSVVQLDQLDESGMAD